MRNHRPRPLKDTTYRYPIELEVQVDWNQKACEGITAKNTKKKNKNTPNARAMLRRVSTMLIGCSRPRVCESNDQLDGTVPMVMKIVRKAPLLSFTTSVNVSSLGHSDLSASGLGSLASMPSRSIEAVVAIVVRSYLHLGPSPVACS